MDIFGQNQSHSDRCLCRGGSSVWHIEKEKRFLLLLREMCLISVYTLSECTREKGDFTTKGMKTRQQYLRRWGQKVRLRLEPVWMVAPQKRLRCLTVDQWNFGSWKVGGLSGIQHTWVVLLEKRLNCLRHYDIRPRIRKRGPQSVEHVLAEGDHAARAPHCF